MDFEKIKARKDSLLIAPRIIGGMCVADLGIVFIQQGHRVIDDLVASPSMPIGLYMAAKGTINLFETLGLGVPETENTSPANHQE